MVNECGISSSNISLPSSLEIDLVFAGIPEHLILYGLIMGLSLTVFCCCNTFLSCCHLERGCDGSQRPGLENEESDKGVKSDDIDSQEEDNSQAVPGRRSFSYKVRKPLFLSLVLGREDEWLSAERGIGAYQYIKFQRMLLKLTCVVLVVSLISLAVNLSAWDGEKITFPATTLSSLPMHSSLHWIQVILGCLMPWLVAGFSLQLARQVGGLRPDTSIFNRTLMVETGVVRGWGNQKEPADDITTLLEEFIHQEYPECNLVKVTWARDYQNLDVLFDNFDFVEEVLQVLVLWGEQTEKGCLDRIHSCNQDRGVEFFLNKREKILSSIKELVDSVEASDSSICFLFLTFFSHEDAQSVYQGQHSCSGSRGMVFAPRPGEVLWSTVHSSVKRWGWWTVTNICLLFLVLVCSTPAGFSRQITNVVKTHFVDTSKLAGVSTYLPPLLFIVFQVLILVFVKMSTINYGHSSRSESYPRYLKVLFMWLLSSTLMFPVILAGAGNLLEFTSELAVDKGWQLALQKWECAFSADTGAFYINLLVVVGLFKCQLQLHRLGDWAVLFYNLLLHGRSAAERRVVRTRVVTGMVNRNGMKLSLTDEYVWLLVFFTTSSFFCLSCPLVTPAFLLYLTSKYSVDSYLYRDCYTAKSDQPEILTTAVKVTLFASLATQLNTVIFLAIRRGLEEEDTSLLLVSFCLLMGNTLALLAYSRWRFGWPVVLFTFRAPNQEESQYKDDYENPLLQRTFDMKEGNQGQSWMSQLVKALMEKGSIIPGEKVFSKMARRVPIAAAAAFEKGLNW